MSSTDLGEAFDLLQQIDVMLYNISRHAGTLKTEVGEAVGALREAEYIFYRFSSLLIKMGLPPDMQKAIQVAQRLILTIRMLHSAIMLLNTTTPYGWVVGGISLVTSAVMIGAMPEMMYDATIGR